MDTNEIYHHGVLGMSWGKRNGPPYPLDAQGKAALKAQRRKGGIFSKKKKHIDNPVKSYDNLNEYEIKQRKEQVIREGNVQEAYKNRNHYTDSELKSVQSRYTLNKEIKDLSDADIKNGMEKINAISEKLETVNRLTNAVAVGAGNAAKIYNVFAPFMTDKSGKQMQQVNTSNLAQYQSSGGDNKKNKKKK